MPLFTIRMPLLSIVLSALFIFNLSLISEVYIMLISILGVYSKLAISGLFTVLFLLIRLLLIIRRANNSITLYDRLFYFAANHYSSAVVYSLILLVSVGLVFCCGDFSEYGHYICVDCDAPRAWGLYFQDSASPQMEALVELHCIT